MPSPRRVGRKELCSALFGLTSAERRWYEKLAVDPYTDNAVLRKAIHKTATVEAAAGFGMRFVGIPSIPGIGDLHQVMEAVYREDPATIRARTKATRRATDWSRVKLHAGKTSWY